jgi:hypothetical protein
MLPALALLKKHSTNSLQPMMLGIFGLFGFVAYSVYLSPDPLVRRSLFNSPTAITAYAGTFTHGVIVWSLLYYLPLFFEVAKDFSPVTSGIVVFPLTFTVAPAATVVGVVIAKSGRYRPSIASLTIFLYSPILTRPVDRLVSHHSWHGPAHLPQAIHQYPVLGLPVPRSRHWNRNVIFGPRLRMPSLSFKCRRPFRGRDVQVSSSNSNFLLFCSRARSLRAVSESGMNICL